ncbi:MAG TPA: BON domain-containing protein [Vicinamibacterales bacterium]|nr:BON domain-containing protein [Vicinamibacterales bacterium]
MRSSNRSSLLMVVLLLVVGGLIGYWVARPALTSDAGSQTVGTTGTQSSQETAREKGREVGEKIAVATEKVKENVEEAAVTAKIKAKMALDDSVKARAIDVTTTGSTVTLTGTVRSAAEHERAVALARETAGITRVVDRLTTSAR